MILFAAAAVALWVTVLASGQAILASVDDWVRANRPWLLLTAIFSTVAAGLSFAARFAQSIHERWYGWRLWVRFRRLTEMQRAILDYCAGNHRARFRAPAIYSPVMDVIQAGFIHGDDHGSLSRLFCVNQRDWHIICRRSNDLIRG